MSDLPFQGDRARLTRFLDVVLDTAAVTGAFVDTDLRHTWVHNPAPAPTEEEILGQTDADLFPADIAEPTMAIKREAIDTASRVEREFTFVKPWGQHRYRAAAEPLYDADGAVEGAMFTAVDISDRYQLLNRTSDAVYTVDTDWRVTFWNDRMAERTGVEPADIVGETLWDVFDDAIPSALEERYRTVMETGEPAEFEQYIPDPLDYWVEIRVFADADGLSIYSRDITERKEREQRLETQRDNLDILNQVLRHDVRNDLQLVLAYTEALDDHLDEAGQEKLATVRESAEHAVDLTRTAREIADVMLATGDTRTRVDLREVLMDELEDVRAGAPDASVSVAGTVPAVSVLANEMLDSVFRNLLTNAIRHNDAAEPEVTVSVREEPDHVVVRVADNGPGVPDARKEAIFGKGEKGLESDGTGIGLYLVETLVDHYGGAVAVADNEPRGAVFDVELLKIDTA